MAPALTHQSFFGLRFWAWIQERFAPANWIMFFVLWATAFAFGRHLAEPLAPVRLEGLDLLGALAAWCFFFLLRVFDEHKDYELDCQVHPQRVLQRGLITLSHLKVAGAMALLLQAGISLWLDHGIGPIFVCWLVVLAWSLLMAKEFFAGDWLKPRLLLYASSHMLIMPMALVWLVLMGLKGAPLSWPVAWLAALSFFSGAAFEVTRKTWGPEEEKEGQDSYARILGVRRAPLVILFLLTLAVATLGLLVYTVRPDAGLVWYGILVAVLCLPAWSLLSYRKNPSAKGRKHNEAAVGLCMLAAYVILVLAIVLGRGIQWL